MTCHAVQSGSTPPQSHQWRGADASIAQALQHAGRRRCRPAATAPRRRRPIDAAREHPADFGTLNTTGHPEDDRRIRTEPGRWRCFYEDVADALTTGRPPAVSLESVRRQIAVIDAVYQSHRTGAVVRPDIRALSSTVA